MKTISFTFVALILSVKIFSQTIPQEPPYKRFPEFPPVKLLLPDSTSHFTKDDLKKKSQTLLILFSPDCDHCRHETEELLNNIDRFKKVQIIMATFLPFEKMMAFYTEYELEKYDNIIVGQDFQYFLSTFFMIKNLPFHAFYNKNKELISAFEGSMTVEKMLIALEK